MRESKKKTRAKQSSQSMLIGYQRVSTDDQKLELQHDALTAAGVHPDHLYEDKLSGAKTDRPGLEHAIRACREGDILVVWRLDRLGRSLKDLIAIVEQLEERGVGLRSVHENIDTTTASGRLFFHIMGALAEFERNLVRERTRAGLMAAKRRGRVPGRKRSFTETQRKMAYTLLKEGELTVGEIAAQLDVSPATIYRYFPGGREGLEQTAPKPERVSASEPSNVGGASDGPVLQPPPELEGHLRLKTINEWLTSCPLPPEAFGLPKDTDLPLRLRRMTNGWYRVVSPSLVFQGPELGRTLYHALDGLWTYYVNTRP